jgi:hypothetical protein
MLFFIANSIYAYTASIISEEESGMIDAFEGLY